MISDGTTYTIHTIPYSFFSFSFLTILSIIYPWLIGFDLHLCASTILSLLYILLHCYSSHIVFFALVSFLFSHRLFPPPLILCRSENILACGPDRSAHSFFFPAPVAGVKALSIIFTCPLVLKVKSCWTNL